MVPWRSLLVGLHILGAAQVEQSAQECRHCCRKQGILECNALQPSASVGINTQLCGGESHDGWKIASRSCPLLTQPPVRVKQKPTFTHIQTNTHIYTHLVIAMPLQHIGDGPCEVWAERIAQQVCGQDVDRVCRCTLQRSHKGGKSHNKVK